MYSTLLLHSWHLWHLCRIQIRTSLLCIGMYNTLLLHSWHLQCLHRIQIRTSLLCVGVQCTVVAFLAPPAPMRDSNQVFSFQHSQVPRPHPYHICGLTTILVSDLFPWFILLFTQSLGKSPVLHLLANMISESGTFLMCLWCDLIFIIYQIVPNALGSMFSPFHGDGLWSLLDKESPHLVLSVVYS